MAYESDEEQIEAIKRWWDENGKSLIAGVVIVVVVLFGYRQWQGAQETEAQAASGLYQNMADLVAATGPQSVLGEEDFNTALELHDQLRAEYGSSIYSRYTALLMARLYVEQDDLESAEAALRWILDNPDLTMFRSIGDELALTARARLARVVLAGERAQEALDILAVAEPGPFAGIFAEIEGDAYQALGRQEDARGAYQRALDAGADGRIIQLKLDNLDS